MEQDAQNKKLKVLFIDDDDVEIFINKKKFAKIFPEYLVYGERDGQRGLAAIQQTKPDLVFLNINMPVKNGWEVLEELKRLHIKVPILMYSSSSFQGDIDRAKRFKVCGFISKPLMDLKIREIPNILQDYKERLERENYQIGLTLQNGKVRAIKLFNNGKYELFDDTETEENGLYIKQLDSNETAEEFEFLINNPKTKESTLHHFFHRNQDFILNDDYEIAHSKINFEHPQGNVFVPDFILEPYNKGALCDLLELKLPNSKLFTMKKNRFRYSSAVFEACAQLREYAAYFDDKQNRDKVDEKYNLTVYKPKMIVIIGRSVNVEPEAIKRAKLDLPDNLEVKTYDEILMRMKRKKR